MKKIVSMLCVAALSMMLVACGSANKKLSDSDIYNTWIDETGASVETITLNDDLSYIRDYALGIDKRHSEGYFVYDQEHKLIVLVNPDGGALESYYVSFKDDQMLWTFYDCTKYVGDDESANNEAQTSDSSKDKVFKIKELQ